jgi:5-methylcytosine-specific restriction enzyme A
VPVKWCIGFFVMRICRRPGCTALVKRGYCAEHQPDKRIPWKKLDDRKPQWKKDFYSSAKWTQCSILHRTREPLCRQCKTEGTITVAEITHHNPELEELIRLGKDPYADKYLESICHEHHQNELRKKRYAHQ